jgi:hypothetical protein
MFDVTVFKVNAKGAFWHYNKHRDAALDSPASTGTLGIPLKPAGLVETCLEEPQREGKHLSEIFRIENGL